MRVWRRLGSGLPQVATAATAIAAIGALVFTGLSLRATQEGQYTDRYTKAVEQLGSPQIDVRLGAIYALERLAEDSVRDSATIANVLSAFVRNRTPPLNDCPRPTSISPFQPLATDIKAAINVRQHMRLKGTFARFDLSHTCFAGNDLTLIDLSYTELTGASLQHAKLQSANLRHVVALNPNLTEVDLTTADLSGSHLIDADMSRSKLGGALLLDETLLARARLNSADLSGAQLKGAILNGANLTHANLKRANLRDADLRYADLTGADRTDADLTGAIGLK